MANTRSHAKSELRSKPGGLPTMGVREFVRNGIAKVAEPTIVMRDNVELGTWYPRGSVSNYILSTSTPPADATVTTGFSNPASGVYYNASSTSPVLGATVASQQSVDNLSEEIRKMRSYLGIPDEPEKGNTNG